MKIIEIIVRTDGTTHLETKGFVGNECQQDSKFIEQALGSKTREQFTSEFYEVRHEQHRLQEGS
jgi:hypothetical protein